MRLRIVILVFFTLACCVSALATDASEAILAKATQLFGEPLNIDHRVFPLNDAYAIWLILDADGTLFQVVVGPKSYYREDFPNARQPSKPEYLSDAEYEDTLLKISKLRQIGKLQQRHGAAIWSTFGPLNTDRFEWAFVERIVGASPSDLQDPVQHVRRFIVYFLEEISGSPERVMALQEQPMVCLVRAWYYLPPDEARRVRVGEWRTLKVAGPNLHGTTDCVRTTVLHDADGFMIEEPQNETIVASDPYRARVLAGRVSVGGSPLGGANVEVKRMGSKKVSRCKTDATGAFRLSGSAEGRYKFKVTKDGFKALTGTIVVDRKAPKEHLSFELYVGT